MHSDFSGLLENNLFSDVTLKVEGKEFKLHKNILAARSQSFCRLFNEKIEQYVFTIADVKCKTMRHLLQFIYGEEVNVSPDIAIELLMAADKFKLDDLKFYCEEVISEDINIGNVAHLHILADTFDAKWLRKRTLNFIINNARDVLDTSGYRNLAVDHKELLEEIFREMVKRQSS